MVDPNRIVISAPRSGLNWLRYCVEAHCRLRTPGKTVLLTEQDHREPAFVRSHDPLAANGTQRDLSPAWTPIAPTETGGASVALIVRDPLELFVRMAGSRFRRFELFTRNLAFFVQSPSERKRVFYYEEITQDPAAMWALLQHLELAPSDQSTDGFASFEQHWSARKADSWAMYDHQQSRGGGAQTRGKVDVAKHHQKHLSLRQKRFVWAWLEKQLAPEALLLIDRYRPQEGTSHISMVDRARLALNLFR